MVYKCIICGVEYPKRESLQAHLKVHKNLLCDFNVRIPRTLRDDFKRLCDAHGVTTCHVAVGLLAAAVEGFRRGVVFEWDPRTESARLKGGSNPLQVTFFQTFLGKPRSGYKVEVPAPEGLIAGDRGVGFEPTNSVGPVSGSGRGRRSGRGRLPPLDPGWLRRQLEVR